VVHPVLHELLPRGRLALGHLVLVVGKDQVPSAAVDVEGLAQVAGTHGRALDVPARSARAPRALPGGLTRLRGLPQSEVLRVPLPLVHFDTGARGQLLHLAAGELAVAGEPGGVHVDVTVDAVGQALLLEGLDDPDDVVDVLGGPGEMVDGLDPQGLEALPVVGFDVAGQLPDGPAFLVGPVDELVVDVGDVQDEGDTVAFVLQVALDGVEDHRSDQVTDVAVHVDRRPADIHPHLPRGDRFEGLLPAGQRVIHTHASSSRGSIRSIVTPGSRAKPAGFGPSRRRAHVLARARSVEEIPRCSGRPRRRATSPFTAFFLTARHPVSTSPSPPPGGPAVPEAGAAAVGKLFTP